MQCESRAFGDEPPKSLCAFESVRSVHVRVRVSAVYWAVVNALTIGCVICTYVNMETPEIYTG